MNLTIYHKLLYLYLPNLYKIFYLDYYILFSYLSKFYITHDMIIREIYFFPQLFLYYNNHNC